MLSIPLYSKLDRSRPLIFLNANQMIKLLIIKALLHKAVLLISCLKNPLMEGCVNVIKHVLKYPPVGGCVNISYSDGAEQKNMLLLSSCTPEIARICLNKKMN